MNFISSFILYIYINILILIYLSSDYIPDASIGWLSFPDNITPLSYDSHTPSHSSSSVDSDIKKENIKNENIKQEQLKETNIPSESLKEPPRSSQNAIGVHCPVLFLGHNPQINIEEILRILHEFYEKKDANFSNFNNSRTESELQNENFQFNNSEIPSSYVPPSLLSSEKHYSLPSLSTSSSSSSSSSVIFASSLLHEKCHFASSSLGYSLAQTVISSLTFDPLLEKANRNRRKIRHPTSAYPNSYIFGCGPWRVLFDVEEKETVENILKSVNKRGNVESSEIKKGETEINNEIKTDNSHESINLLDKNKESNNIFPQKQRVCKKPTSISGMKEPVVVIRDIVSGIRSDVIVCFCLFIVFYLFYLYCVVLFFFIYISFSLFYINFFHYIYNLFYLFV